LADQFVNQTNCPIKAGALMTMGSGFPPFFEFGSGILCLFRGKAGTGFNLSHDFPGPVNITTMLAVNLDQFEP
jgi:hypothetical protein